MLSYLAFPIRIAFSALLMGGQPAETAQTLAPTPVPHTVINTTVTIDSSAYETSYYETETGIYYETRIKSSCSSSQELGYIMFSYNKLSKTGYISRLHIPKEHRQHSYGSKLLKFALAELTQMKCITINWQACPFDLAEGERSEDMLPKLIAFYKRHGAQVLSQGTTSAQLAYYPKLV